MKVLIEIDDKDYADIMSDSERNLNHYERLIKRGKPIPKGHGRLFDERDIVNGNYEIIGNRIYELEPIIEADKEIQNG